MEGPTSLHALKRSPKKMMKTMICLTIFTAFSIAVANAQDTGLSLRAVVDEGSNEARELTDKEGSTVFVSSTAIITPEDVESATVEGANAIRINFRFKASAHSKLNEATKSMIGQRLAVIIDGTLISAPVVQEPFSSGASVTGNFTRAWAEAVVERINANPKG